MKTLKVALGWAIAVAVVVGGGWFWWYSSDHIARGKEAWKQHDYKAAEDQFTAAIATKPREPDGYYYRAMVYLDERKYDQALRDADQLVKDDRVGGFIGRGQIHLPARLRVRV